MATDLNNLEIGLQMARAAIKESKYSNHTYDDPDFQPLGPMYWNANAFHRYYILIIGMVYLLYRDGIILQGSFYLGA